MLRIHLFGTLSVLVGDDDDPSSVATHIGGRPGSLLALLALTPGRYFSRSELASTMWADHADGVRSGTVNTVLWRLRNLVERPPIANRDLVAADRNGSVGLNPNAQIALDVHQFASLVLPALAKPLERTTAADVEALRRGIELYRADLLADLNDEWVLREREKHRRHRLNALGRLMQLSALARDYDAAIQYAQAIIDQDALRENAHRELMRLYLDSGQRALALRQFEVCRAALRRELAIQPMPETIALYRSIADHAVGTRTTALAAAPIASLAIPDSGADAPGCPRDLVEAARRHLTQADAQLQMTLSFL